MKKILTLLLLFVAIGAKSQSPSTELLKATSFTGLENKVKPGYGTKANPIPSGAFKYTAENVKLHAQMLKLMNSYRWPNGDKIDFSKRFSTLNESKKSMVDCYTLIKPGTTDTIFLFVDPYQEDTTYFVPEGLVAATLPILEKELQPFIQLIEEIKASSDLFPSKEKEIQLLSYMYKHFGMPLFIDADKLSAIVSDNQAEKELCTKLAHCYMINKFYAYGKI